MGFGCAGSNYHPVEVVLLDHLFDFNLGILAAGKKIFVGKDHIRKRCRVFLYRRNIHHPADVDTAVADKYPDSRFHFGNVDLLGNHRFFGLRVSGRCKIHRSSTCGGAGFRNRTGNVFGALENPAGVDPFAGGRHRQKGLGLCEIVFTQVDMEPFGKIDGRFRYLESHRKNHDVKGLLLLFAGIIHPVESQFAGVVDLFDRMNSCLYKPDAFLVSGAQVVFLVILAKGPDIHIEYGTVKIPVGVFLGDHGFLYGIHAADRRAVAVSATVGISGTDALEPGNFLGIFSVRGPLKMPQGGSRGAQDTLELKACHHVGIALPVIERLHVSRIKCIRTLGEDHRTHLKVLLHRRLCVIHRPCQARVDTLVAFRTDAAPQAPVGFLFCLFLIVTEGYFKKITLTGFRIQTAHRCSGSFRLKGNIRFFKLPDLLPAFGQVLPVDKPMDTLGRFLSAGYGFNHRFGAVKNITAGKHPFRRRLQCYRIHL